ncbi:hypothetical protein RJT34_18833 [Clitoria ternatea]|uniref:C2H2-type domain-containing protein n=1 Tax=Clitoria ternatea TaxID=43366 RepID=A0AAN9IQC6_CLITE
MDLNYPDQDYSSKSSSEETEQNDDDMGSGRFYECIFCKRGFTTAQALGGHMNIHRKDRANNNKHKPIFSPPSTSHKVDHHNNNYADHYGFNSDIPSHHHVGDIASDYPHTRVLPPHHVRHTEVLCVENQRGVIQPFAQDLRNRNLSLYTNPLCVHHEIEDKFEENEENGLDLELRLGHHHP